jgi:flagellar protein FlaG
VGFSLTISEAIIVIASIILASGFSSYAIYAGSSLQSNILQNLDTIKRNMHTRVDIVYATINETTNPSNFVIYVKNTGTLPLYDFDLIDVYVGAYGQAMLYFYNSSAAVGSGKFKFVDANGDGVCDVGEAATIQAFCESNVTASLYEVKVVPYRGISSSYLFSPP